MYGSCSSVSVLYTYVECTVDVGMGWIYKYDHNVSANLYTKKEEEIKKHEQQLQREIYTESVLEIAERKELKSNDVAIVDLLLRWDKFILSSIFMLLPVLCCCFFF